MTRIKRKCNSGHFIFGQYPFKNSLTNGDLDLKCQTIWSKSNFFGEILTRKQGFLVKSDFHTSISIIREMTRIKRIDVIVFF